MIFLAAPTGDNAPLSIIRSPKASGRPTKISRTNTKALLKNKGWKGKWSGREELKYIQFLELHKHIMNSSKERVNHKIFAKMSKAVRSRTANQCRSHHQKLITYHSSVENILVYYKRVVFKRWQCMIRDKPSETSKIAAIKRLCANQQLSYSLRVIGATVKIQIDVESVASYSFE